MISKIKEFLKRFSLIHKFGNRILANLDDMYKNIINRINKLDAKIEYLFWVTQNNGTEDIKTTKQRVFESMPQAQGKARLIQLANNAVLKELKTVCDVNGIEFYLVFGTLLGAIRNHGFIPWDDDVDIAITRSEYQKLVKALENSKTLFIENYYSSMYQKFTKLKLKASEKFFADVFILDEFAADESNVELRYNELKNANLAYVQEIRDYFREMDKNICDYSVPKLDDTLNLRMTKKYDALKAELGYYGAGDYVCFGIDNPTFIRNMGYVYKKSDLYPAAKVSFEGEIYSTFAAWDAWLTNSYGDYWALPQNIISGHNDFKAISYSDFECLVSNGLIPKEDCEKNGRNLRIFDDLKTKF